MPIARLDRPWRKAAARRRPGITRHGVQVISNRVSGFGSLTTDPWFCLIQNVNRADRPPCLTRARPKSQGFMLRIAALVLVIGASLVAASLAAGPAAAQFGNQPPPRPPGD